MVEEKPNQSKIPPKKSILERLEESNNLLDKFAAWLSRNFYPITIRYNKERSK